MDLEDEGWVNIPYDGLLQVHDDGGNKFFSRKYVRSPKNLFKMDYFKSSREFVEEDSRSRNQLIPLPIQMDDHREEEVKEVTGLPVLINGELKEAPEADLDPIFQVFFKKENEFVEMKMDSSRSSPRGISLPYIDTDVFQYEEKSDDDDDDDMASKVGVDEVEKAIHEEGNEGLNLWKWGVNGIGAFCSFGMAAATICIILLGSGQRHKQHNHKIRIQIFSDDKRIKQVVDRANEAMSAVRLRGVPLSTAHITYGGYYEQPL
ncbi:uncharacterized protein LOC112516328 [Cynara cardunculus var. scolymus]|uniref:DUF6821 domain-containing protein n=1 Tax=Cynara cardunculus var. scolymus TaxID=59895 RepID=A0A103YG03_CYNCS|nr:uncharacterized protein LOC112516328 [Cynara cardunculus var. scolymus]KVI08409.1 hypothetical protein Ccrd_013220 [Cynara cardunculus var. scolymus]